MPHFGWAGPGKLEELEFDRVKAPELSEPTSVNAPGEARESLWQCKVCDRRFKKSMILARHFNANHVDLKQNKESWRDHAQEVLG